MKFRLRFRIFVWWAFPHIFLIRSEGPEQTLNRTKAHKNLHKNVYVTTRYIVPQKQHYCAAWHYCATSSLLVLPCFRN